MSSEIENEVLTELKHAAKPLVELALYGSAREFIRDVTSEFIKHKIEFYKKQLKVFEKKIRYVLWCLCKEAGKRRIYSGRGRLDGMGSCREHVKSMEESYKVISSSLYSSSSSYSLVLL